MRYVWSLFVASASEQVASRKRTERQKLQRSHTMALRQQEHPRSAV
jgi:hypothetical protein